jgi:hypothetical protein
MDLNHIPPYYINMLSWWEFEEYVKRLNERIERDNKQSKEQQKSQPNVPDYSKKIPNVNSMMNNLGKYKP